MQFREECSENTPTSLQNVPTCFKTATIIPMPNQSCISTLNDSRLVELTPSLPSALRGWGWSILNLPSPCSIINNNLCMWIKNFLTDCPQTENGPVPQHWSTTRMRVEPIALFHLHKLLHSHPPHKHNNKICRWHNCGRTNLTTRVPIERMSAV